MANLIELDFDNAEWVIESMLGVLSQVEQGAEKAAARAINKTLVNGASITGKMVSGEFYIRQKDVRECLSMHRATYSNVRGQLNFTGRGSLPLIRYVSGSKEPVPTMPKFYKTPKQERVKGVRVKMKKAGGIQLFPNAFVAQMPSGHVGVFGRSDREAWDSDITELYGTSFLTWLQKDLVADELEERMSERFEHHLEHEATYVLKQAGLR